MYGRLGETTSNQPRGTSSSPKTRQENQEGTEGHVAQC